MKRTSLNTSAFAGAIMLVGLAAPVRADQEIKIGLMLPMKGVFAQLAQDIDKAWVLALDHRFHETGLMHGIHLASEAL